MTLLIPCRSKISSKSLISHHFRDKRIFAFYTEIQDGRQKWQENHFGQKVADKSTHTLWVLNFVEIALSLTVFEINDIFHFCQNSRWQSKIGKV